MNIQNASMTANEVAKAGFAALGTGALVGIASYGGAMMFGTASTGTAIAALSGAAKTNATLAWFGGGAKAAGGLGMAGGKLILAGVVVAPIVAVAAVIAGAKGKEKLAEAKKIHAEAEEAVSQMNIMTTGMEGIAKMSDNYSSFIKKLNKKFAPFLQELERIKNSHPVDADGMIDFDSLSIVEQKTLHVSWLMAQVYYHVLSTPIERSAANSVFDQAGGQRDHWGKYNGMDRLIRKDEHYNADGSMLKEAKKLAKNRAESQDIHAGDFRDVHEHLTDELHYGDATSGGTTFEEVQMAYETPEKYAKAFERKAVKVEMKCTAVNMAKASFVTTGIVSGVTNMFEVFQDKKELDAALHDVGADAIKGAARGGATGIVSTAIRYKGIKAGSALLSDSVAATVMAGGIIDGGVALYSYARGEIDEQQLKEQLVDTTAKAATTIYFTKAVGTIMGSAVNPILPMVVYTTASYVVTCTREIIKNANLNAAEYDRMTAILLESAREMDEYHEEFKKHVARCEERQRKMFDRFIDTFEYNLETGENYDQAIYAICQFADEAGIALQYVEFDEFSRAMKSKESFVLK